MPATEIDLNQFDEDQLEQFDTSKKPVESDTLTTAPGSPIVGDRYIIAGIGGDWSTFAINDIVEYTETGWVVYTPIEGDSVFIKAIDKAKYFNGSTWQAGAGSVTQLSDLSDVGNNSPTDGNVLVANGTIFNAQAHRLIDGLEHDIVEDSEFEVVRTSGKVTSVVVYTDETKTAKIRETLITRTSGKVTQIVKKQYAQDGVTVKQTITKTFDRTDGKVVGGSGVFA